MDFIELSDYIIAYCNFYDLCISNKKLQKLMYYCQAWNISLNEEELIEENFEAWRHGAVLRPLYFKYWKYGYGNIYMENNLVEKILDKANKDINQSRFNIINKVLRRYAPMTADELENKNHTETPWLIARGCLEKHERCDEIIRKDIIERYYKSKALERGMKDVKDNTFKFSSTRLKKAQENLRKKKVFEVKEENYEEYEKFIVNSYEDTLDTIERAEYVRTI